MTTFWFCSVQPLCVYQTHDSFDNSTTQIQRWKTDRFETLRGVFETFNKRSAKKHVPDEYVAIDEI